MATKIYTDKDANLNAIRRKKLAVIGFGSQGHAHALNLKESGCDVTIGLYAKSKSRPVARKLGFKVMNTSDAVKHADVIFIATPDTVIPSVYEKDVAPNLTPGKTLLFSHGFAVHFDLIETPDDVDVIMVAPKGPGHTVRGEYVKGGGVPCLVAVDTDATGKALEIGLSYCAAIGGGRSGIIETDFKEECET
ncbi:MAG TPA: ketol-acid reductoisomerase, partial [Verrucomicrobiales bacterium]|nr:ketol-acid reductoisomerase [Verrucomicrobiales bacterium]